MDSLYIIKKLFREEELKIKYRKLFNTANEEISLKNYQISGLYFIDLAHISILSGNKLESKKNYQNALNYLRMGSLNFSFLKAECLIHLGEIDKALKIVIKTFSQNKSVLAQFYEIAGADSQAQNLYEEIALIYSLNSEYTEDHLFPLFLQHHSDLWTKAQNMEKARHYNEKAREKWEKIKDNLPERLLPIEKGWLFEEIGYIYEKAGNYEAAMNYYDSTGNEYNKAFLEEHLAETETYWVDGDGEYYIESFSLQVPYLNFLTFRDEHFKESYFRRIKYRILNVNEKIKSE
jgi:tetratricopeptide (TPR) repeat protein